MSAVPLLAEAPWYGADPDGWVRRVVAIHCDPTAGAPYWLDKQRALGFDARDAIRGVADLYKFGPMRPAELRSRPLWDFLPHRMRRDPTRLRIVESGGTTGHPCRTAYDRREFDFAFAAVFAHAARAVGWPEGVQWLACVPGAPHLISDAARRMAHAMGSPEPFTIDLDPRWVKRLEPGSPEFERYVDHLLNQAMDVLRSQHVEALFSTPKLIVPLAERMPDSLRDRIRAIHLGGLAIAAPLVHDLREQFPHALFLAGYGNSLLGLAMEATSTSGTTMDYFAPGPRVIFNLVRAEAHDSAGWLESVSLDQPGRVLAHRLDETCMLLNLLERDHGTRIPASDAARALGWRGDGIRDPHVPAALTAAVRTGVY